MGHNSLSISNIAWTKDEDSEVYHLMQENGFRYFEIAPSRIWEKPYEQTDDEIEKFKNVLKNNDITIIALQSLLFGHPEFAIFRDENTRRATLDYLKKNIILARKLGAQALIFGSPKNRIIGDISKETAYKIAIEFFQELGEFAQENNTCFCIEPNPAIYGGDFILTTQEAIQFVQDIDSPGLKLNIDLGTITANNEDLETTLRSAIPYAGHFHISEPFLEKINLDRAKYMRIREVLTKENYNLAISIEMKALEEATRLQIIEQTLNFVSNIYGSNIR